VHGVARQVRDELGGSAAANRGAHGSQLLIGAPMHVGDPRAVRRHLATGWLSPTMMRGFDPSAFIFPDCGVVVRERLIDERSVATRSWIEADRSVVS
jgi:hypothetical protein